MRLKLNDCVSPLLCVMLLSVFLTGCGGAEKVDDPPLLSDAKRYAETGGYWLKRKCYEKAEQYFLRSLKNSRLMDDVVGIIKATNNLGTVALAREDLNLAGEYFERALILSSEEGSISEQPVIYGNLAGLAYKLGKNDDAELYWKRALELAETHALKSKYVFQSANYGRMLLEAGRLNEAESVLNGALKIIKENEISGNAAVYQALGEIMEKKGDLTAAEGCYNQALTLDRLDENPFGIVKDLERLALLYLKSGKDESASIYLDRTIRLYTELGNKTGAERVMNYITDDKSVKADENVIKEYKELLKNVDEAESILCY